MFNPARLILAALTVAALSWLDATGASAATLFTTPAHTTHVSVGAFGILTSTGRFTFTNVDGPQTVTSCSQSWLRLSVAQNSDAGLIATVSDGKFTDCTPSSFSGTFSPPWTVTALGTGTVTGANTRYVATIDRMGWSLGGGLPFFGSATRGVTLVQPTVGTAPICLALDSAGPLPGQLGVPKSIDDTLCFPTGTFGSGGWSLGD